MTESRCPISETTTARTMASASFDRPIETPIGGQAASPDGEVARCYAWAEKLFKKSNRCSALPRPGRLQSKPTARSLFGYSATSQADRSRSEDIRGERPSPAVQPLD